MNSVYQEICLGIDQRTWQAIDETISGAVLHTALVWLRPVYDQTRPKSLVKVRLYER